MKKVIVLSLLVLCLSGCGAKSPISFLYPKDDFSKTLEFAYADARDLCAIASLSIKDSERKIAKDSMTLALMGIQGGGLITIVDALSVLGVIDTKLKVQLSLVARRVDERISVQLTDLDTQALVSNIVRGCKDGLAIGGKFEGDQA